MMKNLLFTLFAALVLFASSCASIVSYSNYPMTINTTPSNLAISVTNRDGVEVYRGKSPATINLKSGAGFFKAAQYFVKVEGAGFDAKIYPIDTELDAWYFGNILLGGVVGMLIVDPATGAMYKLSTDYLHINMENSTTATEPELRVYDLTTIPAEWHERLEVVIP